MSVVPIRIGIIGAGNIVKRRHLPGFAEVPDCEVVCVANRRRANAEEVAAQWGIARVLDTPEQVCAQEDINVVLVGTTPRLHMPLTLTALEAGKHVFCQARMAASLAEAQAMYAAAKKHSGLVTMLCPTPRVAAVDLHIRKLLAADALGKIRLLTVRDYNSSSLDPLAPLHWRMDADISGCQISTLGQYVEIVHRWFEPARSVSAWGKVFTVERRDAESGAMRPVEVPESVNVSGELKNGAHFVYTFSAVAPCPEGEKIEIFGSKGALTYVPATQTLMMSQQGTPWRQVDLPEDAMRPWRVEADFVSAIREGTPVYPTFADGLVYMEFMEAVARSMREDKTIHLPL